MSRLTKWKLEKNKVKVVFRLQFHATHIPQTGWNNLFISFIPADSGKATAKTNKSNVRNGTCKWSDPIYESTRLLQDAKTKQFEEKFYKLVVGMGTTRSSILGEANMDLSEYVDALKPAVLALPLQGSDAVLHVTVQLLTSKTGFREFEQQREVNDRGLQTNNDHDGVKVLVHGDSVVSRTDKVNARVRFKAEPKEHPSLEEDSGLSEEYADSAAGFDGSSNTSESLCAEKHDNSCAPEIDSVKSMVSGDPGAISPVQSPRTDRGKGPSDHHFMVQGTRDWVHYMGAEHSVDTEIYEENSRLRAALEAANRSIHELSQEMNSLRSHSNEIGGETQKLAEQLKVEISSEKELAKDIAILKSESLRFKNDLEWLRSMKMNPPKTDDIMSDTGLGVELCHPEGVLLPGLLTPGTGPVDPTSAMQGEMFKLLRELDESKAEREALVRKMDQMECYYEALVQELEENQKQILGELQNLRNEHSSCLYTVSSTKAQMEAMHQQMNDELLHLSEQRCSLEAVNKELERRAIASEASLKRARLNYSIAVNKLQKDLEVLSLQVVSMYETNENLIRKAFSEASEPLLEQCPEAASIEAEDLNNDKLMAHQKQIVGVKNQTSFGDRFLEESKRSLKLQEELYQKIQQELSEMHLAHVELDVFSLTLHMALLEAAADKIVAREMLQKLARELELSSKSRESLELKLQNIMTDLFALREEKENSVLRCNDLALQNQALEVNLKKISDEKCTLSKEVRNLEIMLTELRSYKSKYDDCIADNTILLGELERSAVEKENISGEVSLLREELALMKSQFAESSSSKEYMQKIIDDLRERLQNILASGKEQFDTLLSCGETEERGLVSEELVGNVFQLEELQRKLLTKMQMLVEENKELLSEHDDTKLLLATVKTELEAMKQKFQCEVSDMVCKINVSSELVGKLHSDVEAFGNKLKDSSVAEEKYSRITDDLFDEFVKMEAELRELTSKNGDLADQIRSFGDVTDELEDKRDILDKMTLENTNLKQLLQTKTAEYEVLALELNNIKSNAESLADQLSLERCIRSQLEADVLNLGTQVQERDEKLPHTSLQEAELGLLKEQLSELESDNTSLHHQVSRLEEQLKTASEVSSSRTEMQLQELHSTQIAADVTKTVVTNQYGCYAEELVSQIVCVNEILQKVNLKNCDLVNGLEDCLASKENYAKENERLLSAVECLRSELESCATLKDTLESSRDVLSTEFVACQRRCDVLENTLPDAKAQHNIELEELRSLVESCLKEIDDLFVSKEELEIRSLVLEAKIEEKITEKNLLEKYEEEQLVLQKKCSELSRKLSEQVLKTEEFKNLSIHLKELKDKAEAEHIQAREKTEADGPSASMQESLRIAFIKEQYETKLQEVKQQLSISKKHGEEMLWKLQDAVDELEDRKKCEASLLDKNEELLQKISEVDAQLQLALSDNRERLMAYDQLKAELECSLMTLDCCREEKKQLMVSLQQCTDEKSRLAEEIALMREQLENLKALMRSPENEEKSPPSASHCGREALDVAGMAGVVAAGGTNVDPVHGGEMNLEPGEGEKAVDVLGTSNGHCNVSDGNASQQSRLADQLKTQDFLSGLDRLQKELELMRSENIPEEQTSAEAKGSGLHIEQVHFEKVTEELGNMSSMYDESSRNGNAIERVLALELELADALQAKAKKRPGIQFQSSFLKLHSDEAAVFQSFRDINELIKDLIEMKGRHNTMEAELKEMHKRYSQLSLQFAEVEGERQKLMMTLKNTRPSKRRFSLSPSPTFEELSP